MRQVRLAVPNTPVSPIFPILSIKYDVIYALFPSILSIFIHIFTLTKLFDIIDA